MSYEIALERIKEAKEKNATELYLTNLGLKEIPKELFELTNLTLLYLANNQITELPKEIGKLSNLIFLYLSYNQIIQIPDEIRKLTKLERIVLINNRFNIPEEIYETPPLEQIEYILKWQKSNLKPLNEAKALFVGDGGVGKTSVIKRILYDKYNEQEAKTEGIEIKTYEFKDENIKLNFWDFGGQEIMHSTHEFFLTNRSLYILLWDSRAENRYSFIYWLEYIKSFGGDSPILIAVNKIDENSPSIDEESLKERYTNIKEFYKISCKQSWGICELKEGIKRYSLELPHIRDDFPLDWFQVKDRLEKLKNSKDYISFDKFQKYCKKQNINDKGEQERLIKILHDLGVVLCFRDSKRLKDTNIINPAWATEGIYRVINSSILREKNGFLDENDLDEILKEHRDRYDEEKDTYLLDLMKKFELSYEIKDGKYIVAEALSSSKPKFEWNESSSLCFRYDYNFLPRSIISRFIIKNYEMLESDFVWLNGIVLKDDGRRALIKAEDKRIYIYIEGEKPITFLHSIRSEFKLIHQDIKSLDVKEMVPLTDNHEIAVPYDYLLTLEKKRVDKFIPYGSEKEYSVSILLNNIESKESRGMENGGTYNNNYVFQGQGIVQNGNGQITINNNQNSELDKKLDELIEQINQNQIENSKEIIENIKKLKNDKKSLNDYLIDLLGMGGNIGSIVGGISGVLALLK